MSFNSNNREHPLYSNNREHPLYSNNREHPLYSNNREYRQSIRDFFKMNTTSVAAELNANREIYDDAETYDEMLYDAESAQKNLAYILEKTENNPLFDELYSLAAAKMFSTDREVGLCILLAYDFFADFYPVWILFDKNKEDLSDSCECYVHLKNKLRV